MSLEQQLRWSVQPCTGRMLFYKRVHGVVYICKLTKLLKKPEKLHIFIQLKI